MFEFKLTRRAGGGEYSTRPDALMEPVDAGRPSAWRNLGERACFSVVPTRAGPLIPSGWYWLTTRQRSLDGAVMSPCLYPTYAKGADGNTQITLPEPDDRGQIATLVLFKYDVLSLRFCPMQGIGVFESDHVHLVAISRAAAFARMLGSTPRSMPARLLRFVLDAMRGGISRAADALYRDYLRRQVPLDSLDYPDWCARFDTGHGASLSSRPGEGTVQEPGPLVSILLPVYDTPEKWLRRCIESVRSQLYGNWELCIADDASPSAHVSRVLAEYAAGDARIKVLRRAVNGHISEASNSALSLATGEFVALLDHDDELRPHALLEIVAAAASAPDVGLVYSDEDKVDLQGRRFDPYFKPDFDPDLLRGQNYVCHFTAIRTQLVREVGGFRKGFEGSQDHDLILRCTERLSPGQVVHVPKVLYHWRAIPGSTALSRDAKDYASSAGARAVGEHLGRRHPGASVEELSHGHYRVRWPLPAVPPPVSLVIPTRDRVELLRMCVSSLLERSSYPDFEIVVVDNGSVEAETLRYLDAVVRDPRVRVIRHDAPFNYSQLNNLAVAQCDGEVVGLLNNDIEVITPDWLEEMVSQAIRPGVGAVGAMLYYPNDTIQHAGVVTGIHGVAAHMYAGMPRGYPGHGGRARVAQSLTAVTGACLVVRREVYEQVGGLDESLAVAFNDIDFCLRLRQAGYRNVWTPFAEMYHHESASRGTEDTEEKKARFAAEVQAMVDRWGDRLGRDPAYNPNLSLSSNVSELAFPPRSARGG